MIDVPVLVKEALRDGRLKKKYRFLVLNDDGTTDFTIDNNNLISESVSIDERMVSGDTLKFGLTEGTSLEFRYFGFENIRNRRINAFIDVQYVDGSGVEQWYSIPMGFFTVEKCSRQTSTGIYKVTAYNKLMSSYLDAKANDIILENINEDYNNDSSLYHLLDILLNKYTIDTRTPTEYNRNTITHSISSTNDVTYTSIPLYINNQSTGDYLHVVSYHYRNYYDLQGITDEYISTKPSFEVSFLADDKWEVFKRNHENDGYQLKVTRAPGDNRYIDLFDYVFNSDYDDYSMIQGAQYVHNISEVKGAALWKHTNPGTITTVYAINGILLYNYDNTQLPFRYCEKMSTEIVAPIAVFYDNSITVSQSYLGDLIRSWSEEVLDWDGELSYDYKKDLTPVEKIRVSADDFQSDVSLRDLQTAVFEIQGQFGQLDRETDLFFGKELGGNGLYPAEDLYPNNSRFPSIGDERAVKALYSQLWTDNVGTQTFRNLIITYKTTEGSGDNIQEVDKELQISINNNGTTDYYMDDNWIFRTLIWQEEDVLDYVTDLVAKLSIIKWFPFEMWCAGLPYIETGDKIEIVTSSGTETSYILQRDLKGIQNLQDTYINGTLDVF